VETLGAGGAQAPVQQSAAPAAPTGELTADSVCQAIGAVLPEGAIVSDESQTSGVTLGVHTAGAAPHDFLALTGGAIGQGLPLAVGAAVACPDRPVFALEADGSAMYTIQALWTMAREGLNVTTVIFNNRSYSILNIELQRVGADAAAGPKARAQLDLAGPDIDFVAMAQGLGVPAERVDSADALVTALRRSVAEPGPRLIEVVVPPAFSGARLKALPYGLRALEKMPRPLARAIKRRVAP
jgi:acetolactate synthase-1/2/3 large subunit